MSSHNSTCRNSFYSRQGIVLTLHHPNQAMHAKVTKGETQCKYTERRQNGYKENFHRRRQYRETSKLRRAEISEKFTPLLQDTSLNRAFHYHYASFRYLVYLLMYSINFNFAQQCFILL